MSVIVFPSTLVVSQFSWGQQRNDTEFRSSFGAQAVEVSAPLWVASMSRDKLSDSNSQVGQWQALLLKLRGRANQLGLWNLGRPVPLGTMRGVMTLDAGAVAGATTLSIVAAGEAAKTLRQGDLLGLGSGLTQQVVAVVDDATANGSGVISITIEPALRNAHSIGASVTWDKPQALFRRSTSVANWDYTELLTSGFALDLIEDVRP